MVSLMQRRREMMVKQGGVVCPYITNGLIFWLDGIEKGDDPTKWTDLIGKREFTLYNTEFLEKGVKFKETVDGVWSRGEYPGAISNDWANETVEIAINPSQISAQFLFPPRDGTTVGIQLVIGSNYGNVGICANGTTQSKLNITGSGANTKTISAAKQIVVSNKVQRSYSGSDKWGGQTTGHTFIGGRNYGSGYNYVGIIYSIRIYSRKLSVAEMISNQEVDNQRFGLGL